MFLPAKGQEYFLSTARKPLLTSPAFSLSHTALMTASSTAQVGCASVSCLENTTTSAVCAAKSN